MEQLLTAAGSVLGATFMKAYTSEGAEIEDVSLLEDGDAVFFSRSGGKFKQPGTGSGGGRKRKTKGHRRHSLTIGMELGSGDIVGGYKLGRLLGTGGFGAVRHAVHTMTGDVAAIKFLPTSNMSAADAQRVNVEISSLAELTHDHIIKLKAVVNEPAFVAMVLEYAPGGELKQHLLHLPDRRMQDAVARTTFSQIARGVAAAHAARIIHRDLKLENVLVGSNGEMKISDFGLAQYAMESDYGNSGSLFYLAPEIVKGEGVKYGHAVDVWALGVILYGLVCGRLPFLSKTVLAEEARLRAEAEGGVATKPKDAHKEPSDRAKTSEPRSRQPQQASPALHHTPTHAAAAEGHREHEADPNGSKAGHARAPSPSCTEQDPDSWSASGTGDSGDDGNEGNDAGSAVGSATASATATEADATLPLPASGLAGGIAMMRSPVRARLSTVQAAAFQSPVAPSADGRPVTAASLARATSNPQQPTAQQPQQQSHSGVGGIASPLPPLVLRSISDASTLSVHSDQSNRQPLQLGGPSPLPFPPLSSASPRRDVSPDRQTALHAQHDEGTPAAAAASPAHPPATQERNFYQEAEDSCDVPTIIREVRAAIAACKIAVPPHVSPPCADLIRKILQPDPAARPSILEVLAHPWLRNNSTATLIRAPSSENLLDDSSPKALPAEVAAQAHAAHAAAADTSGMNGSGVLNGSMMTLESDGLNSSDALLSDESFKSGHNNSNSSGGGNAKTPARSARSFVLVRTASNDTTHTATSSNSGSNGSYIQHAGSQRSLLSTGSGSMPLSGTYSGGHSGGHSGGYGGALSGSQSGDGSMFYTHSDAPQQLVFQPASSGTLRRVRTAATPLRMGSQRDKASTVTPSKAQLGPSASPVSPRPVITTAAATPTTAAGTPQRASGTPARTTSVGSGLQSFAIGSVFGSSNSLSAQGQSQGLGLGLGLSSPNRLFVPGAFTIGPLVQPTSPASPGVGLAASPTSGTQPLPSPGLRGRPVLQRQSSSSGGAAVANGPASPSLQRQGSSGGAAVALAIPALHISPAPASVLGPSNTASSSGTSAGTSASAAQSTAGAGQRGGRRTQVQANAPSSNVSHASADKGLRSTNSHSLPLLEMLRSPTKQAKAPNAAPQTPQTESKAVKAMPLGPSPLVSRAQPQDSLAQLMGSNTTAAASSAIVAASAAASARPLSRSISAPDASGSGSGAATCAAAVEPQPRTIRRDSRALVSAAMSTLTETPS